MNASKRRNSSKRWNSSCCEVARAAWPDAKLSKDVRAAWPDDE
jgi:hypothetical protein